MPTTKDFIANLNSSKVFSASFESKLTFFGHTFSENGIILDSQKIHGIVNCHSPEIPREVHSLIDRLSISPNSTHITLLSVNSFNSSQRRLYPGNGLMSST